MGPVACAFDDQDFGSCAEQGRGFLEGVRGHEVHGPADDECAYRGRLGELAWQVRAQCAVVVERAFERS